MKSWEKYIKDVDSKKILTCELVQLTIERHLKDLKRKDIYFDKDAANKAIHIIENLSLGRDFDEDGNPKKLFFKLTPFQSFIVSQIFGWKLTKNGRRRYRYAYCEMARKQGKSTLAAAIALLMFISEHSAEVYTIATKRDQAKIVFDIAKKLVAETPFLADAINVQKHNMSILTKYSKCEPLSSDSKKQDGLNPSCVINDEYHEHPTDSMFNVMKSGMGARKQPFLLTITTAGFDKFSPCYKYRNTCVSILKGQLEDDSTFAMIFTLDEEDDWEDRTKWIKADPNLGITVEMDYLEQEYRQAKNNPTQVVNFQTKNLNIWTQAASIWIKDKDWISCPSKIEEEELKGAECWGGLDLAKTIDLNALCLSFPNVDVSRENMEFKCIWKYWIPEDKIRNNRDNIDYTQWVREGFIEATPGREVDYEYIIDEVAKCYTKYNVMGIAYDPYMANASIVQGLEKNYNIVMTTFPQGFKYLSEPTAYIENLVVGKKLNHGNNPVTRWMCGNVELESNPEGLVKMSKRRSKNKIDGMYALANSLALWKSIPETETLDVIYV